MNIANSITVTNNTGKLPDFSVIIINKKIITIDTQFTLLKSWLLISTRSFIKGPSPAKIAFSSYSFTKSSSKKARGEYEGSIKTAREVLAKYL